jgi:hypothetical protein
MGYGYKIPANQLGKSKNVWPIREYAQLKVRRFAYRYHKRSRVNRLINRHQRASEFCRFIGGKALSVDIN